MEKKMFHLPSSLYILAGLLLSNTCLTFAESSGSPATNDGRITEIQMKLLTVQTDILNLNTAIVSGDSSGELKTRLTKLESLFQNLKEKLADERRQDSESVGSYDTSIALLMTQYEALQKQLTSLQTTIADKVKAEQERNLPNNIQDAIKSQKFRNAEEMLIQMADNNKIQGIIHQVYANSIENTDLILEFSKDLTRRDFRLSVLKALLYEIRSNGHRNPYKLIAMVRDLENSVISSSYASEEEKDIARTMISEIVQDIKSSSEEILKNAMYTNTYAKNVEIEKLSDALNAFRSDILEEVMPKIVNESFSVVASDKILDNLHSHKNVSQILSGIVALFYKMESTGNSNDATMINMGDYIKELQGRNTYNTISAAQKDAVTSVIEKLPTCVRSIFFEPHVCFFNRGSYTNRRLSSRYKFSANSGDIMTFYPGYQLSEGGWKVTRSGDKFYFESVLHPKSYLYSGGMDYYGGGTRRLVNAIKFERDRIDNKGAWNMELSGDFCYFKNVDTKEYMCAMFHYSSARARNVFTWIPGTDIRREEFQWQLKRC